MLLLTILIGVEDVLVCVAQRKSVGYRWPFCLGTLVTTSNMGAVFGKGIEEVLLRGCSAACVAEC